LSEEEREQFLKSFTWSEDAIQGELPTSLRGRLKDVPILACWVLFGIPVLYFWNAVTKIRLRLARRKRSPRA